MTRILTTHVGSLPRTQEVVDFIFARERRESFVQADFDAAMSSAVLETVKKQVDAGVDIPKVSTETFLPGSIPYL